MDALPFFLSVLFFATAGFVIGRLRGENVCNSQYVDLLANKNKEIQELSRRYYDLIYCVAQKFPGETRHDTAKRYILNAEIGNNTPAEATDANSNNNVR